MCNFSNWHNSLRLTHYLWMHMCVDVLCLLLVCVFVPDRVCDLRPARVSLWLVRSRQAQLLPNEITAHILFNSYTLSSSCVEPCMCLCVRRGSERPKPKGLDQRTTSAGHTHMNTHFLFIAQRTSVHIKKLFKNTFFFLSSKQCF